MKLSKLVASALVGFILVPDLNVSAVFFVPTAVKESSLQFRCQALSCLPIFVLDLVKDTRGSVRLHLRREVGDKILPRIPPSAVSLLPETEFANGQMAMWTSSESNEILKDSGALQCNYVFVWDRHTRRGGILHVHLTDPAKAQFVFREALRRLDVNINDQSYVQQHVRLVLARGRIDAVDAREISQTIARTLKQAAAELNLPLAATRPDPRWSYPNRVRFDPSRGVINSIGQEEDASLHEEIDLESLDYNDLSRLASVLEERTTYPVTHEEDLDVREVFGTRVLGKPIEPDSELAKFQKENLKRLDQIWGQWNNGRALPLSMRTLREKFEVLFVGAGIEIEEGSVQSNILASPTQRFVWNQLLQRMKSNSSGIFGAISRMNTALAEREMSAEEIDAFLRGKPSIFLPSQFWNEGLSVEDSLQLSLISMDSSGESWVERLTALEDIARLNPQTRDEFEQGWAGLIRDQEDLVRWALGHAFEGWKAVRVYRGVSGRIYGSAVVGFKDPTYTTPHRKAAEEYRGNLSTSQMMTMDVPVDRLIGFEANMGSLELILAPESYAAEIHESAVKENSSTLDIPWTFENADLLGLIRDLIDQGEKLVVLISGPAMAGKNTLMNMIKEGKTILPGESSADIAFIDADRSLVQMVVDLVRAPLTGETSPEAISLLNLNAAVLGISIDEYREILSKDVRGSNRKLFAHYLRAHPAKLIYFVTQQAYDARKAALQLVEEGIVNFADLVIDVVGDRRQLRLTVHLASAA